MYTVGIYSEDDLYKARKGAEVGTIKEFKVKGVLTKYIKTANGWRPYGKKKQAADEEAKKNRSSSSEQEVSQNKTISIEDHAKNASDKQLEAAVNDPNQKEEVKNAAKKELENRKQNSSEKENEGEKIKENDSKQESEGKKIKQITQTYVKVDGGQIIIRMNKEKTKYKASKGGFKLESQEGEDISDFKKRVKEEYQKREEIKDEVREEVKKEQEKESQKESEKVEESKPFKEEKEEVKEIQEEKPQENKDSKKEDKTITKFKGIRIIDLPSGEKIACVMNSGQTEYIAMKGKFNIHSKEGEDLPEFEQRVKEEYSKFLSTKKTPSKKLKEQSTPKKEAKKEEIKEVQEKMESSKSSGESRGVDFTSWESAMKSYKLSDKEKKQYTEILKSLKPIQSIPIEIRKEAKKTIDSKTFSRLGANFNGSDEKRDLQIALNYELVSRGYAPYLAPFMYENYKGQKYMVMDQSVMNITWCEHHTNLFTGPTPSITSNERIALKMYSKGLDAKIRKALSGDEKELNNENTKNYIKDIDSSMKKYVLGDNIILSRRVSVYNKKAAEFFGKLTVGSEFTDKSFSSFSSTQLGAFGAFQITLLAKKGQRCFPMQKVSQYKNECEFLMPRDVKYRVLQRGTMSLVVEIVE